MGVLVPSVALGKQECFLLSEALNRSVCTIIDTRQTGVFVPSVVLDKKGFVCILSCTRQAVVFILSVALDKQKYL